MFFYVIGIDYKQAPLKMREAAIRKKAVISDYLYRLKQGSVAVLFTCNRVEIYGIADDYGEAKDIEDSLKSLFPDIFKDAYVLLGREDVFKHGLKLASGLESRLRGEFQVLLQIENWLGREGFPNSLRALWNDIILSAKYIRQTAGLSENTVNIADVIFEEIAYRLKSKRGADIIVVGTGKIADLIAGRAPDWARISFVARKKRKKAEVFARKVGGEALLPKDMQERLAYADALISATSSPHYALRKDHFNGLDGKRQKPLYVYDVAVPRDVEPAVAELDFVSILDIGRIIDKWVSQNQWLAARLEKAAGLAEKIIAAHRREYEDTHRIQA